MAPVDPAALILAGGLSSRMGEEKATLTIESKPLIRWAYDAATRFSHHIYVSIHDDNTLKRYKRLLPDQAIFVKDIHDGPRSALLALLSSFASITEETVAVMPVDSPFVDEKLMIQMLGRAKDFNLIIPMWPDGKLEAIHAVYARQNMTPTLQDLWSKGILELREIPRLTKTTLFIATEDLSESDAQLLSLRDADTPKEFDALKIAWMARR